MRPLLLVLTLLFCLACLPLKGACGCILDGISVGGQLDGFRYTTDHFWNRKGNLRPAHNHLDFTGANIWLFGSFGSNWQLNLTTAWQNARESLNGTSRGLADIELSGTTYLRPLGCGDLFAQGVVVLPSGRAKEMIRYGCWGVELGLLYRYSLRMCRIETSLGFRGYGGDPSDLVRGVVRAHFWPERQVSLSVAAELDYGLFNGKKGKHPNALLYNNNYRLLRVEGLLNYNFWRGCCLNGGGFYHLWGENIGNCGGFFGGVSCVF